MNYNPVVCSGFKCTERNTNMPWSGEFQWWDNTTLDDDFWEHFLSMETIEIVDIFRGTHDDEWAIHFYWYEPSDDDPEMKDLWAEAWYDPETEEIHCCVRDTWDPRGKHFIYGPNPEQKYFKAAVTKTMQEFAEMLLSLPFDILVDHQNTTSLDAERARSREYKAGLKQDMNTALAMALHGRLGKESAIACIGRDMMAEAVRLLHHHSPCSKYYKFY